METLTNLTIALAFFFPSTLEHTKRRSLFLYLTFQLAIILASRGCFMEVVLLGRNLMVILEKCQPGYEGDREHYPLEVGSFSLFSLIVVVGIVPATIRALIIRQRIKTSRLHVSPNYDRIFVLTSCIHKKCPGVTLLSLHPSFAPRTLFVHTGDGQTFSKTSGLIHIPHIFRFVLSCDLPCPLIPAFK